MVRNPGMGWKIVGFYYMGQNTVNNATGGTIRKLDTMVSLGYNVTL